jgi:hypothetical protein
MKPRFWICIVLAALLASCAHAGGSKPAYTFDAAVPEGWKTVATEEPMLFMTKDGGYKQFVLIRERPLTEPFQFTKKTMRAGTMPEEAAQIIINEILADPNIRNFSVTENIPARMDVDGYVFKTIYYGFIKGDTFYNIRYGATQEDYFQQDLKTFEKVLASFKLAAAK